MTAKAKRQIRKTANVGLHSVYVGAIVTLIIHVIDLQHSAAKETARQNTTEIRNSDLEDLVWMMADTMGAKKMIDQHYIPKH